MKEYKINKIAIFKNFGFCILLIIFTIGLVLINYYTNFINATFVILVVSFLASVCAFLALDYFINSTRGNIYIDKDCIRVIKLGNEKCYEYEEISKVLIYAAPSIYRKSALRFLPFEVFHYVEIVLFNNENLYITSLSDSLLYSTIKDLKLFESRIFLVKKDFFKTGNLINSIWINGNYKK